MELLPETVTASNSHAVLADELAAARTALRDLVAAVKYERETIIAGRPLEKIFCAVPTLDRVLARAEEVLGA